eukprot:256910-Pelagomonas_calceolata.AAC.1
MGIWRVIESTRLHNLAPRSILVLANQANNNEADTGIPRAGPRGNPISRLFWLAKEEKRELTASTSTAPTPNPKITYLPNLQNAL